MSSKEKEKKSIIDLINLHSNCAPGVPSRKIANNADTCLTSSQLQIIAKELGLEYANLSDNKLWEKIDSKLADCNSSDFCWTNKIKSAAVETIRKETFKPKRPLGERQWLSNVDIEDVMIQYEKLFPNFAFYGPASSDLFKENLKEMFNIPTKYKDFIHGNKPNNAIAPNIKKNIIAITFNTDPHTKGGEHWVTLVIRIEKIPAVKKPKATFMYFDSVGKYPNDNIAKSIMQIIKMFDESNEYSHVDLLVNRKQHQKKNTECGVYSLNFILKCLNNEEFEDIINDIMPDDTIQTTRNTILFST